MPKAYCYLSQKTIDQLNAIKQDEGHEYSSQTMKEMIELGIKVYAHNKENPDLDPAEKRRLEKEEELNRQHTTHLLRLLGISADIFRCVYDKNKLNVTSDSPDDHISELKKKVDNYIEGYINN
jgi:Tfp pilus assembly protein PilP